MGVLLIFTPAEFRSTNSAHVVAPGSQDLVFWIELSIHNIRATCKGSSLSFNNDMVLPSIARAACTEAISSTRTFQTESSMPWN
jgi:hypothetical protein